MDKDTIDRLLARIGSYSPEFGSGFSCHAPMTMLALNRIQPDVSEERLDRFVAESEKRFEQWPEAAGTMDGADWRAALGDHSGAAAWRDLFAGEIERDGWRRTVALWAPRLAPGLMAGATHGIIRAAYATEYLEEYDTPIRRNELAIALGYWAARYQPLPDGPGEAKSADPAALLGQVPRLSAGDRVKGMIFSRVVPLAEAGFFGPVRRWLDVSDPVQALNGISACAAALYLQNSGRPAITFIHCLTATHAARTISQYLAPEDVPGAVSYLWQAVAALYSTDSDAPWNGGRWPQLNEDEKKLAGARDEMVKLAASVNTDHVVKYAYSTGRESAANPNTVYDAALARWLVKSGLL